MVAGEGEEVDDEGEEVDLFVSLLSLASDDVGGDDFDLA